MSLNFNKLIPDLQARLAKTIERLAELKEARRPHALDAVSGDGKAKKAIARLDKRMAALIAEQETLAAALEEADRRKVEDESRKAAEDRLRREAKTGKIGQVILAIDREVDHTLATLSTLLTGREEAIRELDALGVVYPGVINALRRRRKIAGAMVHVGLHRFVNIELPSPNARQPLAESDHSVSNPTLTAEDMQRSA